MRSMKRVVVGMACLLAGAPLCGLASVSVTSGEELIAAVNAASETEPSVIEIGELDIYLLETVKLTKPITLRGAGIGKTVLRRSMPAWSLPKDFRRSTFGAARASSGKWSTSAATRTSRAA